MGEVNGLSKDTCVCATSSVIPVDSSTLSDALWTSFVFSPGKVVLTRTAEKAGFNDAMCVESS